MVERLPEIEVTVPVHDERGESATWNGEVIEVDEVKIDGDKVQVVIAGVTYDEYNALISVRHEQI